LPGQLREIGRTKIYNCGAELQKNVPKVHRHLDTSHMGVEKGKAQQLSVLFGKVRRPLKSIGKDNYSHFYLGRILFHPQTYAFIIFLSMAIVLAIV
jgi:hypothetical protein